MTTTSEQYTIVFCVPSTVRITSMFGSDNAGPANRIASAGPLPIPAPNRPSTMGTSVRVEKYMKAPRTEARRVEVKLLSPTAQTTHSLRSDEHTSELQSLMRNSYAVFCLKKKKRQIIKLTLITP